ncbi:hypothetical protein FGB62_179g00 [Gracilaria domingensis]|nr:hypothetical protein FGB62_179g00 [Gracilaria domingensis]
MGDYRCSPVSRCPCFPRRVISCLTAFRHYREALKLEKRLYIKLPQIIPPPTELQNELSSTSTEGSTSKEATPKQSCIPIVGRASNSSGCHDGNRQDQNIFGTSYSYERANTAKLGAASSFETGEYSYKPAFIAESDHHPIAHDISDPRGVPCNNDKENLHFESDTPHYTGRNTESRPIAGAVKREPAAFEAVWR